MEELGDGGGGEWRERAMEDSSLAADVLLCLRGAPKVVPWRGATDPAPAQEVPPSGWGSRGKRSRVVAKDDASASARRRRSPRASPMTPLDFSGGSGSSESGSEEGPSAAGSDGAADPAAAFGGACREAKVMVAGSGGSSAFRIPDPKPIRRTVKKKTMSELLAIERALLEEREMLRREMEERRRAQAALVEENQRLKSMKLSVESQSQSQSLLSKTAALPEKVQPKQLQSSPASIPLPDLNIPLFEELD